MFVIYISKETGRSNDRIGVSNERQRLLSRR
jgi:hypothetical protein